MTMAPALAPRVGLWNWSLFAALIASAGLPIYIHAPKFYVDTYGQSLAALGGALAILRLIDVVQDPVLGWVNARYRTQRGSLVAGSAVVMAISMLGLFSITPPVAPLLWFSLCLIGLFSGFSFLTIAFYAQGVDKAQDLGASGHIRLAGWRETGSLIGVSVAAVAPTLLALGTDRPFAAFALGFCALAGVALFVMRYEWSATRDTTATAVSLFAAFRPTLADPLARRLLVIALLNATPVAVTSTLFLFFVESRLSAPGMEGPLLLLFFLSAAASAPIWARFAQSMGAKRSLMIAMGLAILAFLWAVTLTTGDLAAFAVICATSGAAMGADLTLLPAIFARRLAALGAGAEGAAFGLWSFVSKLSLAAAAATLLPALQLAGFSPGADNAPGPLFTLSLLYAALPCALKLLAILLLARTDIPEV